ncbi:MAG: family 16 glycoside hydrolase [Chloroflexales bacterium]
MRRYRTSAIVSVIVAVLILGALAFAVWQVPQGVAQEQQPLLQYPAYPPTPTVGPKPTPEPALSGVPLAQASFDTPDTLSSWTLVDLTTVLADNRANWVVANGRLVQDAAGRVKNPSIQETAALTGSPAWTDYTVQVSFYDEMNGTAGLIARYQGSEPTTANYYRYRILKNTYAARPKQVLEKVEHGVATTLVEVEAPGFTERTWNVVALTVVGGQLTVRLNGQVVAEGVDKTPLAAGQAGIYTRAIGGISFDDFSVVAP